MKYRRTEDDADQSENNELTDDQEGKIPSDDGSVQTRMCQGSHVLWNVSLS